MIFNWTQAPLFLLRAWKTESSRTFKTIQKEREREKQSTIDDWSSSLKTWILINESTLSDTNDTFIRLQEVCRGEGNHLTLKPRGLIIENSPVHIQYHLKKNSKLNIYFETSIHSLSVSFRLILFHSLILHFVLALFSFLLFCSSETVVACFIDNVCAVV